MFILLQGFHSAATANCPDTYTFKLRRGDLYTISNKKISWRIYYSEKTPTDIIFKEKKTTRIVLEWDHYNSIEKIAIDRVGLVYFIKDTNGNITRAKYSTPQAKTFLIKNFQMLLAGFCSIPTESRKILFKEVNNIVKFLRK
ncbi:MAG: hypothetical protein KAQ98_07050 [Bacteriovoracaceae bacterium]|nr:hypothetical protein [Bacteriovoracaceae bacterium]